MNQTTRYLLGLILVLALCLVALEWNTDGTGWTIFDAEEDDLEAELELSPLHRDEDEVPMMVPTDPQEKPAPSEELHLVDEDVEFRPEQLEFQPPKEEDQVKDEEETHDGKRAERDRLVKVAVERQNDHSGRSDVKNVVGERHAEPVLHQPEPLHQSRREHQKDEQKDARKQDDDIKHFGSAFRS